MKNQMKFKYENGKMKEVFAINFNKVPDDLKPSFINEYSENIYLVDIKSIRSHWKEMKKDWFPQGRSGVACDMGVSVFWTIFMLYIFPWLLDIAKVYCAFQICQAFYRENKGMGGKDGRTGFQSLVYYGKWYLAFWLVPFGVELIDQIGQKMHGELLKNGLDGLNGSGFSGYGESK